MRRRHCGVSSAGLIFPQTDATFYEELAMSSGMIRATLVTWILSWGSYCYDINWPRKTTSVLADVLFLVLLIRLSVF
jgi:hypothetical protein